MGIRNDFIIKSISIEIIQYQYKEYGKDEDQNWPKYCKDKEERKVFEPPKEEEETRHL